MSTASEKTKKRIADLHYEHLPQVCFHGSHDPHRCTKCQLAAQHGAQEQVAAEEREAERQRRAAIAQQLAPDPQIEALARFLQEHLPDQTPGERAMTFFKNKDLQAEWERTKHDLTSRPLF